LELDGKPPAYASNAEQVEDLGPTADTGFIGGAEKTAQDFVVRPFVLRDR
jgi:hypothetical protein